VKTQDLIQLGALGLVAYLAYQKFAQAKPNTSVPNLPVQHLPVQPSVQIPDFGVTHPNDPGWGDNPSNPADFGLQNVIDGVIWG
jgi:hypothetical protein